MPPPRSHPVIDTPRQVVELVVNLDDTTGEIIGYATQTLLDRGALDVWTTPIQMKKQRPGVMLSVLARSADAPDTAVQIMQLTGSFGVRHRLWDRTVLDRETIEIDTHLGPVSVKVGRWDGRVVVATPEYETCRQLAETQKLPLRRVMDAARAAAHDWLCGQTSTAEETTP